MPQVEVHFTRSFIPNLERDVVSSGTVVLDGDQVGTFNIPELMKRFMHSNQPVPALVEAHWPDGQEPEERSFCGAAYEFTPLSGLIAARNLHVISGSETQTGVILHPNTTVRDSEIGAYTEVGNTSTILASRIGKYCTVGTNSVIDATTVFPVTNIEAGRTILSNSPVEVSDADYANLRTEGARWE